jgi:hypothetical protein
LAKVLHLLALAAHTKHQLPFGVRLHAHSAADGPYEWFMVYAVQVAGYEQLLRKVLLKAPQAALLSMACFSFKVTHKGLPGAYWKTAEDMHAVVAKRWVRVTGDGAAVAPGLSNFAGISDV